MMGKRELLWNQCMGIGLNLELIWPTYTELFHIPVVTSVFF